MFVQMRFFGVFLKYVNIYFVSVVKSWGMLPLQNTSLVKSWVSKHQHTPWIAAYMLQLRTPDTEILTVQRSDLMKPSFISGHV